MYESKYKLIVLTSRLVQADVMLTGRLFQLTPWRCSHEGSIPHGNFCETLWGTQKNSLTWNPSGKNIVWVGGGGHLATALAKEYQNSTPKNITK